MCCWGGVGVLLGVVYFVYVNVFFCSCICCFCFSFRPWRCVGVVFHFYMTALLPPLQAAQWSSGSATHGVLINGYAHLI